MKNSFLTAFLLFLVRYRRTFLGPFWLLIGPSMFIACLGLLYAQIGALQPEVFIPHLAIGLVIWTLINGFIVGSAKIFQRNRSQILNGSQSLEDIVAVDVISILLSFTHQLPIILIVFLIYGIGLSWYALESFIGLCFLIVNGVWVSYVFGILGARFRDLVEIINAAMRIIFLATPIIWMPGGGAHGSVKVAFLSFNPFYHFVEIFRMPLLGQSPTLLSWGVVFGFTISGFLAALIMKKCYARFVPFWA